MNAEKEFKKFTDAVNDNKGFYAYLTISIVLIIYAFFYVIIKPQLKKMSAYYNRRIKSINTSKYKSYYRRKR